LKASVGGYFGGHYTVVIDLNELFITWNHFQLDADSQFRKKIRPTTAQKYREHLKSLALLDWKDKYKNPGILDGTQWSVDIFTDQGLIHKHGDNNYPEQWDDFCTFIAKTTGRKFR